jgi:UDP-glucose:(heptosyl)LPS alpha-1,3-glucosyltransferase
MGAKRSGGLEKYAGRIAASFLERGAGVTVFTTPEMPKTTLEIDYVPFPLSKWPTFLRLEQFDRCVRRSLASEKFDVVFGMERNRSQTHIRAGNGVHAAFLKSRLASEGLFKYGLCHINPLHRKILELEKAGFENPDLKKIFANSHMVQKDLLEHYDIDPAKIVVIHNGVEWSENEAAFRGAQDARAKSLERLGLEPDVFHLLFVGNGYARKGLWVLLEALAMCKNRDFHLSVVGKDKEIERYRASSAALNLQGRVRFFGQEKEVTPFYTLADALVIPSFYDPFANVTLEALSFGLKVISSKTNGGHEILNERNGIVLEELTKECLLAALEKLFLFRKTAENAETVRASVAHLDFGTQLAKLIDACT